MTDEQTAREFIERDRPGFKAAFIDESRMRTLALSDRLQTALLKIVASQATVDDFSPYRISQATDEKMFSGRKAELNTVLGRSMTNYLMFGGRKSGKTSMLKVLERRFQERFSDRYDVRYHNLQAAGHQDHVRLFYREIDDRIGSVEDFVRLFSSKSQSRTQIFLLDEADLFATSPDEFREELFVAMRKLADEGRVFFILAGYWQLYRECLESCL